MSDHPLNRAQVLAEVLRHINDGNYEKAGETWSFGVGWGASRPANPSNTKTEKDDAIFQKMRHLVLDHVAHTVAIERTSLSTPPTVDSLADEFRKLMDELTPETREALGNAFTQIASGHSQVPASSTGAENQLDALDRYYSEEILDKLDGIVSRAAALNCLGLEIVPNRRVQFLFEEAHRCYLYGFHLACAVFCRAILEGALKEVVDPRSETNQSIHEMIGVAVEKDILSGDRPRCVREVAKAGNKAVHDPEMFNRDYSAEKVEEVLTNTRKVLEELYRLPS